MRPRRPGWLLVLVFIGLGQGSLSSAGETGDAETSAAAERGRIALTQRSHLAPAWTLDAYKNVRRFMGPDTPDPDDDLAGYAKAFNDHFGLHPAPFPNDGLPMGLRQAKSQKSGKIGIQVDCMLCHGGSIGGTSYVGLGNTQLDLDAVLNQLTLADGKPVPPRLFTLNTARGTNNAGQIAVTLLSLRNSDLSFRTFPLLTGANVPEMDTPAWWLLKKKQTKYYDGRTDTKAARSNMQFFLGDLSLAKLKELEPTFQDIDAYLKSIEAPKYPFAIDQAKADRGRPVFEATCARCHGTYGPESSYPNKVIPLDVIGTDPARAKGLTDRFIDHYNSTWFGEDYPVVEPMAGYQAPPLDGVWATAPYLHNGSVPTLYHLLKSSERPAKFHRPPSTDFEHYDQTHVGWRFEPAGSETQSKTSGARPRVRTLFDSKRFGLSNQGHTFGDKLTDDERADLIEYLKTL